MSLQQQPPFLICVPIALGANSPAHAARNVEALLDCLGNPAASPLKAALDASWVIHFLSLSVVWDETSDDPPMLVADVAGDGTPKAIIAALVQFAGLLLLPVFAAAAGVDSLSALERLLLRYWVKPVASALPLRRHRATGLAFQGTPGLTVERIRSDEQIAQAARAAVFGAARIGHATALNRLGAARKSLGIVNPGGEPFTYSEAPPKLASAGFFAQSGAIINLLVIDWWFVFLFLVTSFFINVSDIFQPLTADLLGHAYQTTVLFVLVTFLAISGHAALQLMRSRSSKPLTARKSLLLLCVTLVLLLTAFFWPDTLPSRLNDWIHVVGAVVSGVVRHPFVTWMALALSAVAVTLFVALVAAILLALLRRAETHDQPCDADPDPARLAEIIRREDLPPHKQNHLIAVSTIKPGLFRRFVALPAGLYAASLTVRSGLFSPGFLARISTIHFIQWARIPRTGKLVFTADYDGSFQSYPPARGRDRDLEQYRGLSQDQLAVFRRSRRWRPVQALGSAADDPNAVLVFCLSAPDDHPDPPQRRDPLRPGGESDHAQRRRDLAEAVRLGPQAGERDRDRPNPGRGARRLPQPARGRPARVLVSRQPARVPRLARRRQRPDRFRRRRAEPQRHGGCPLGPRAAAVGAHPSAGGAVLAGVRHGHGGSSARQRPGRRGRQCAGEMGLGRPR
jgi:hypothetical protein